MLQPGWRRSRDTCAEHGLACADDGTCVLCRREGSRELPWSVLRPSLPLWGPLLGTVIALLVAWHFDRQPAQWLTALRLDDVEVSIPVGDEPEDEVMYASAAIARARVARARAQEAVDDVTVEVRHDEVVVPDDDRPVVVGNRRPNAVVVVVQTVTPPPKPPPTKPIPDAAGNPKPGGGTWGPIPWFRRPDGGGTGELAKPRMGSAPGRVPSGGRDGVARPIPRVQRPSVHRSTAVSERSVSPPVGPVRRPAPRVVMR